MKQFDTKTLKAANPVVKEIIAELWRELDTIVEQIMAHDFPLTADFTAKEISEGKLAHYAVRYGEWRGQAQGVAYALAVLNNPYKPNIEEIRAGAMRRWEAGED